MCSGSRSDGNYETSISYKSMTVPLEVPAPVKTSQQIPLKSCMRKQSARSHLHPRFTNVTKQPESFFDTLVIDSTPEKQRNETVNHSNTRFLSSTTVDSPVLAFSNATYTGKLINNQINTKFLN